MDVKFQKQMSFCFTTKAIHCRRTVNTSSRARIVSIANYVTVFMGRQLYVTYEKSN